MDLHRSPISLLTVALCLCATTVNAGKTVPQKRLLRQRAKPEARELQSSSENLCKSIIAVGGWRLPTTPGDSERKLQSDNGNAILSEEGLIALPIDRITDSDEEPSAAEFVEADYDFGSDDGNTVSRYDDEKDQDLDTDETFVCELHDGSTLPIQGTQEQMLELRTLLNNGSLISAETSVEADHIGSDSSGVNGTDDGEGVSSIVDDTIITNEFVVLKSGPIQLITNNEDTTRRRRRLNMYEGDKNTLIVRVTDSQGRAVPENASVLSDKFFGTDGDQVTMKSGFDACSFGKFRVTYPSMDEFGGALSAPGVVDVKVNIKLSQSAQGTVRTTVANAVEAKLGVELPGPFQHVVFVVEKCYEVGTDCGFAAYAYINHWLSLFVEDNYKYPAVQMHEIGHNINLAHSGGMDGRTYTDHTCLMGNPLWEDDVGKMCFNPWYDGQHIKVWNSGTSGGTRWSGTLTGVAEYDANSNNGIVLKLETGNSADYFIGFNRAAGPNADNKQADDKVTIYQVKDGDGKAYSHSYLKATIGEGNTHTVENWRKSGLDLVVKAHKIDTTVNPGYAELEVTFGPQTNPTRSPTPAPTNNPTLSPTSNPTEGSLVQSSGNANSGGQMFTIQAATSEVIVSSFAIPGKKDGDSDVIVYTRIGDYAGHEEDVGGWEKIYDKKIAVEKGVITNLGKLDRDVRIPAGSSRSFYVYSKKGMLYEKGANKKGIPFGGDGSIVIESGIGTKKLFEEVTGFGQYSGEITYYTSVGLNDGPPPPPTGPTPPPPAPTPPPPAPTPPPPGPNPTGGTGCGNSVCEDGENPGNCPSDCAVNHFSTRSDTNANSGGQMFTIDATNGAVTISTFGFPGKKDGNGDVMVFTRVGNYAGHEEDAGGWENIFDKKMTVEKGAISHLGKLDREVRIPAGSRQAFYVYSKKGMLYKKGDSPGSPFDSDGSITINEGIGTKKLFEEVTGNGQFSGVVSYY
ncbi:hypothetical protein ACHAXR_010512 [Thalassiosira sp. AJA248-18]